jgi:hypothetical protein
LTGDVEKHCNILFYATISDMKLEPIGKHEEYAGKRIKRGLFRASDGTLINADVNGSGNNY